MVDVGKHNNAILLAASQLGLILIVSHVWTGNYVGKHNDAMQVAKTKPN